MTYDMFYSLFSGMLSVIMYPFGVVGLSLTEWLPRSTNNPSAWLAAILTLVFSASYSLLALRSHAISHLYKSALIVSSVVSGMVSAAYLWATHPTTDYWSSGWYIDFAAGIFWGVITTCFFTWLGIWLARRYARRHLQRRRGGSS